MATDILDKIKRHQEQQLLTYNPVSFIRLTTDEMESLALEIAQTAEKMEPFFAERLTTAARNHTACALLSGSIINGCLIQLKCTSIKTAG